ncbi:MAG TPA: hypothetical protein VIB79_22350 [Candidatus Binatia bacterium]|jgi:hypothetical protein
MAANKSTEHRLALLEGANFSSADLESITKDIEDNQRIIAELEEFAAETPWISLQAQPAGKKA